MYSLDINFLNDRPEYRSDSGGAPTKTRAPSSSIAPLIIGIVIGVGLPALAGGAWFYLQNQAATLEAQKQDLDSKLGQLSALLKQAEEFDSQRKVIEAETQSFAGVFNQIKPWSAMLQDVSERVPPGVQIDSLTDSAGLITITGTARSYSDVNDFLLLLQKSPFLKAPDTQIIGAQLGGFPGSVEFTGLGKQEKPRYELPKIITYRIGTRLSDVPASELLRELDRKGAVGLVTRIRTLQEKGVIKP